jgi:hypothetical protein
MIARSRHLCRFLLQIDVEMADLASRVELVDRHCIGDINSIAQSAAVKPGCLALWTLLLKISEYSSTLRQSSLLP